MPRLTREQSQARTRAKLLEAARIVVAREGYEGASIDRITEDAGFSKGAFYSNFATKEEVFLELLEQHAGQDIVELSRLLDGVEEPRRIIRLIADWAGERAKDPTWGLLALELFRRARRDATFGKRHATLFLSQWTALGTILLRLFPEGQAPADPPTLGGIVFELAYGAASSFTEGPHVEDLVHTALSAMLLAHGVVQEAPRPRIKTASRG